MLTKIYDFLEKTLIFLKITYLSKV